MSSGEPHQFLHRLLVARSASLSVLGDGPDLASCSRKIFLNGCLLCSFESYSEGQTLGFGDHTARSDFPNRTTVPLLGMDALLGMDTATNTSRAGPWIGG